MTTYRIIDPVADLYEKDQSGQGIGKKDSQLLFGEGFEGALQKEGWVHGRSLVDGYEGWVRESALRPETREASHFVDRILSALYPQPDFKTRPVMVLGFLSRLLVPQDGASENGFVQVPGHGWVFADHIRPVADLHAPADLLDTARKFLGMPYLYGGRSALGIDCSGLVQLCVLRRGLPCPRDSGDQEASLGLSVPAGSRQLGDLVFFKGHVGIMAEDDNILNATARSLDVRLEKLADLIRAYGEITAVKRIP
ncbi:MAG: C40 family peptidase [Alphaproteobacteria bacterium]|nr:C40 family peptidase [Alphaproteobacteria bacterium]